MSNELKITKEAVLEAASKCSTAKATLQVLFPDAFKVTDEPFEFRHSITLTDSCEEKPLCIGTTGAPHGLYQKCLIVNGDYEMRTQQHKGFTVLAFHKKP